MKRWVCGRCGSGRETGDDRVLTRCTGPGDARAGTQSHWPTEMKLVEVVPSAEVEEAGEAGKAGAGDAVPLADIVCFQTGALDRLSAIEEHVRKTGHGGLGATA